MSPGRARLMFVNKEDHQSNQNSSAGEVSMNSQRLIAGNNSANSSLIEVIMCLGNRRTYASLFISSWRCDTTFCRQLNLHCQVFFPPYTPYCSTEHLSQLRLSGHRHLLLPAQRRYNFGTLVPIPFPNTQSTANHSHNDGGVEQEREKGVVREVVENLWRRRVGALMKKVKPLYFVQR